MNADHEASLIMASEENWIWKREGWMRAFRPDRHMEMLSESMLEQDGRLRESFGDKFFRKAMAESMADEIKSSWAIENIRLNSSAIRSLIVGSLNIDVPEWKIEAPKDKPDGALPEKEEAAVKATLSMLNDMKEFAASRLLEVHSMLENRSDKERSVHWGKFRRGGVHVCSDDGAVVYVAPPAECIESLMDEYVSWWKDSRRNLSRPIGAALAHLYFVAIHPFEDGNGRMARMLADRYMVDEDCPESTYRPYSISAEIFRNRNCYNERLEMATRHAAIMPYVQFMLSCQSNALKNAARRACRLQEMKEKMGSAWDEIPQEERDVLRFFCSPSEPNIFGKFSDYARRFPKAQDARDSLEAKGIIRNGAVVYPQKKASSPAGKSESEGGAESVPPFGNFRGRACGLLDGTEKEKGRMKPVLEDGAPGAGEDSGLSPR